MTQGFLSFFKEIWQWSKKLENASLLVLILVFALLIVFDRYHFYNFGFSFKDNPGDRVALCSTLLQSVATVFVLIVSLLFVAVQLAAQAYTPRVIKKHFASFHFLFISGTMLATILYLIVIRGGSKYFLNEGTAREVDFALTLSLFCFTLLIPLVLRTYKLMRPKFLIQELVYDISQKDFENAYKKGKQRELNEKLQPLFDIVRGSILKGDLQSAREAFEEMCYRFGKMIRSTEEELLSELIASIITGRMVEIGLFAIQERKIELTIEIFLRFENFLRDFEGAKRRVSGTLVFSQLKSLREEFKLRYPRTDYPKQWLEVTMIYTRCQRIVASIIT